MTQIAPATLIAIQSYAAPAKPGQATPASTGAFEPLSAGDFAPRQAGGQGDVQVRLSSEALAFLGSDSRQSQPLPEQRTPVAPRATAEAYRSEPPGSRLDITV